jgi:general stress protein YciG
MTKEVVMTRALKEQPKRKQGFASLSLERRREIASMGGRSIPDANRAFSKQRDLAREAGRKGGLANRRKRRQMPAA